MICRCPSVAGMGYLRLLFLPIAAQALCASAPLVPAIELVLPVDCAMGETCFIQKYVDRDPGAARLDYHCGQLTTQGHDGTDFRLRDMADMRRGAAVLAAADGTVLRVRDGEPDIDVRRRTDLGGRDAGNGVVIDHGQGWESQSSHMRAGSVAVRPGQRVRAGDRIGLIGMSGQAEFPHLHFALRYQGQPVDPFTGPFKPGTCTTDSSSGWLWTRSAARALGYRPGVVITGGLAPSIPPASVADRGNLPDMARNSANLIFWVDVIGARPGDVQTFTLTDPGGAVIHHRTASLSQGGLIWFAYSGKRAPPGGWVPGEYRGQYRLARSSAVIADYRAGRTIR